MGMTQSRLNGLFVSLPYPPDEHSKMLSASCIQVRFMPSRLVPKNNEKPLTLGRGTRAVAAQTPLRQNLLLFSGIGLVLVAATMFIGTALS